MKDVRGREVDGTIDIPSIRELLSILWNGGSIDFSLSSDGWSVYDLIVSDELTQYEKDQKDEQERDMNQKVNSMKSKL